ncbi:translation initiation factor IF-2-like [Elephas maximus indicus]|uniref:translation initiation factor IF-2-like n=1 Tax=Elephas maximus indicus TaxID=99487 RepID=UPI0021166135|nr:translation initiation factor IF-2-like [Elephas maximus indicus]
MTPAEGRPPPPRHCPSHRSPLAGTGKTELQLPESRWPRSPGPSPAPRARLLPARAASRPLYKIRMARPRAQSPGGASARLWLPAPAATAGHCRCAAAQTSPGGLSGPAGALPAPPRPADLQTRCPERICRQRFPGLGREGVPVGDLGLAPAMRRQTGEGLRPGWVRSEREVGGAPRGPRGRPDPPSARSHLRGQECGRWGTLVRGTPRDTRGCGAQRPRRFAVDGKQGMSGGFRTPLTWITWCGSTELGRPTISSPPLDWFILPRTRVVNLQVKSEACG